MKTLYFTHCCATKDDSLKNTKAKVSPLHLYQSDTTQKFMKRCIETGVAWAIFSDKYGFVFPSDQIQWYEKHPNSVAIIEKKRLFDDAFKVLQDYDLVYFYYNPGRIHPLYLELVDEMKKRGKDVWKITHLENIRKWMRHIHFKSLIISYMQQPQIVRAIAAIVVVVCVIYSEFPKR